MSVFPVINSTLSAGALGQFLRDTYPLSADCTCSLFRTGINDTYLLNDGGTRYAFRVYSCGWRTELEITEELRLLRTLNEQDIPVSYALPDRQGTLLQRLPAPEGLRFGVLFSFAEGTKLRELSSGHCYHLGTLLGRLHRVTDGLELQRVRYDHATLTCRPYAYALKYFAETNPDMQFIQKAIGYLEPVFEEWAQHPLRQGTVHLDIWYDNLAIQSEEQATLFDFDFCGHGYLLYDLAYFMMQLFHTEPDKQRYEAKLARFFAGYESVVGLSAEEKNALPLAGLAIWIFYLGVQSQRFDTWSNIFLSENYLKHFIGLAKGWLAHYQIRMD
jgi:Ser/Thr protein kinase RdoA (MazF antagonist)